MRVDPAVQRRLLDLANVDTELTRIDHRRRTLPELAEITEREQVHRAKRDQLVAVETTLGDLNREATRQESEIEAVRAREDRDRSLLKGGNVGARQLADLEHELATLTRRQSSLEDDLLELMERREAVEVDVAHARTELDAAETALSDVQRRRDEALADLEVAEARRKQERQDLVPQFPTELLALYDRIRTQKGTGAALLRARRCGACRLELDRNSITHIKDAPADEVVRCDECGAILIRTPESGL
ncbi:MAG TPA: C4-type zinc ribbon domain-containing protein [Pseudonocardiaceae bacterium]|nr:C4-type zinc ribbon domain-containing protein [Pseudonocardiaceae bacterium]